LHEFLAQEGLQAECEQQALKEVLADQVRRAMDEQKLSKTAMARRMNTSRRQLDRLLDQNGQNVTLVTISKAARAVGRKLRIELV
jgi:hypothetical protein